MPRPARVFVSYVRENRAIVERLVAELRARGADVWFDREALPPGVFWAEEIRVAVSKGEYFLACFSREQNLRSRTYMNEELELAVQEIRLRGNAPWFIPILFSGEVPDIRIGPTRSLRDLQYVSLGAHGWRAAIEAISRSIGLPIAGAVHDVSADAPSPNSANDRSSNARKVRSGLVVVMFAVVLSAVQLGLNLAQRAPKLSSEPRTNVESAFLPDGMRGGRGAQEDTPLLIAPQPDSKDFLLLAQLGDEGHFQSYRLEIIDFNSGRLIWSQNHVRLGADGIFNIFVPGPYLRPGKYSLQVMGEVGDGREADVATYTIRVLSQLKK